MFKKLENLVDRIMPSKTVSFTRTSHPDFSSQLQSEPVRPELPEDYDVSAYSPRESETDDAPWEAARSFDMRPGTMRGIKYAAVPRKSVGDITPMIPYGSLVNVNGSEYEVRDMMHERFAGMRKMDLFMPETEDAINFGRKQLPVTSENDFYPWD